MFPIRDLNFRATSAASVLMHCVACGSLFPRRFPSAATLGEAYGGYYTTSPRPGPFRRWLRRVGELSRGAYILRGLPKEARTLLDYGCGSGEYLSGVTAERRALEAFGTDLAPPAHLGRGFRWLDLDQIESVAPFDWITLSHVLEHVASPAEVMARLASLLSPEGALWVATPNASGFLFAAAGAWARDVDFPRHRQIFSRGELVRLMSEAGLEADFQPAPRLNAVLNSLSSLRNILTDHTASLRRRLGASLAVCIGLARHLLETGDQGGRASPELIALCRRRPAVLFSAGASCDEATGTLEKAR
ncbi:MAG TPA: class I SAM-dependent methyltransferase [Caulobacteraceae bacterium]